MASLSGCHLVPDNHGVVVDGLLVDTHCHVFNATDLPVYQFVHQVYLENPSIVPPIVGDLLKPFLFMIAAMMTDDAPTGAVEMRQLNDGPDTTPGDNRATAALARGLRALHAEDGNIDTRLRATLAQNTPAPEKQNEGPCRNPNLPRIAGAAVPPVARSWPSPAVPTEAERRQLYDRIAAKVDQARPARRGALAFRDEGDPQQLAEELVRQLRVSGQPRSPNARGALLADPFSGLLNIIEWADLYTLPRLALVQRLVGVLGSNNVQPRLVMPSLVDYGLWLDRFDQPETPFADQVRVMGALASTSKLPAKTLLHGFVGYNPWRAIRDEANHRDPLALVKEALTSHGFIGVKLYPPMGFRGSDNAHIPDVPCDALREFPDFPDRLDGVLERLYAYCEREGVPIMLHSASSQLAYEQFDDCPNPAHWSAVLARHPALRVSFGHFGGFWENKRDTTPWAQTIVDLMACHEGVYADVADFSFVANGGGDDIASRGRFEAFLKSQANLQRLDLLRTRIMFGTDWSMLGKTANADRFAHDMIDFMGKTLGGAPGFAATNALRFAGLDDVNTNTAQRLLAFHGGPGTPHGKLLLSMISTVREGLPKVSREAPA
ncbi:amidohydrolase family protein [Nitrospirillum sp. BR 11164]|uniref:amidohydrolase family protein n=1 Tax=Nitrospirillum sp. BR 11164 TaxID=3104324 RepID=UPI002AFF13C5|nr:amidohydrolase family protein [Nitrospirillum sp. BR 11164]MEA1647826.1 amidohydrolase family protein [Nitrospirillum sp. BR 11164]